MVVDAWVSALSEKQLVGLQELFRVYIKGLRASQTKTRVGDRATLRK